MAQECFVSQSTLSAGINKLKQGLGQLVECNNKNALFTPAGEKVVEQAKYVILSAYDLVQIAQQSFFDSQIKIGVIPTISPFLLPEFLNSIKQKYPNLGVSLIEDTNQNLLKLVSTMELDLILIALPTNIPEGVYTHKLFKDPLHLVHHKNRVNQEFLDKELLLLAEGSCLREHVLLAHDISNDKISDIKCTSLPTLVAMINMEMGVSFLPKMSIEQTVSLNYPNLVVRSACQKTARNIAIACRDNHPNKQDIIEISNLIQHK
ncbi:Hydrogen peroxide-inducible genes activator [uncultured Candidatus Thioglobus sp.]|nr:Hydrogen peroxide-inducible genes activator [uncultured Candidatus Thioglobus sp.]